MIRILSILILSTSLSACTYAAKQVLGDKATPISPSQALVLQPKRIFKITKSGLAYEVCKEDQKNRAMQTISIENPEKSTETVEDKVAGEDLVFSFPGFDSVKIPYQKTKIEGYSVYKAVSPSDLDFHQYVRQSVGQRCRQMIDAGDVVIIESEARGVKSYKLFRYPIDKIPLGSSAVKTTGADVSIRGPSNVTFGIVPAR
jgi:hypothetical protein